MVKKRKLFILTVPLLIGVVGVFIYKSHHTSRQATIHEKGSEVMPFDLEQTTHIFKKTQTGGVQQVVVKDKNNTSQISMIRMHLQMEAGLFQKGDFGDPVKLHGENMTGLKELSLGVSQMKITYSDLPNGGQITYFTDNKNLVTSIHDWFDAQVSDHGSDAMGM